MIGRLRRTFQRHRPQPARRDDRIVRTEQPGAPPGTLTLEQGSPKPKLTVLAYDDHDLVERDVEDLADVEPLLARYPVTWLNVDGLGDVETIEKLGERFQIHRLTLEDVVHVDQRPKVDRFARYLFIVTRMFSDLRGGFGSEQISMIIGERLVITFQERNGDCLDPVRQRLRASTGKLRARGPSYLGYAIVDAITDHLFPVLFTRGERLDALEDEIMGHPKSDIFARIHDIKRELAAIKRVIGPQRDFVGVLMREPSPLIEEDTRLHLRDVADHTVQLQELLESYHELSAGLLSLYVSLSGHRMNEIMKVLTVVGTIFIPLTFITGLYGMNFDHTVSGLNMPELHSPYGYPIVLTVMALVTVALCLYFVRKGWIGPAR